MHKPCKLFYENKKQIETKCLGEPSDRFGHSIQVKDYCKRCSVFTEGEDYE